MKIHVKVEFVLLQKINRIQAYRVFAVFFIAASWAIWRDRRRYIEINSEWIIHNGSSRWSVKRAGLNRVERGRKSFIYDYGPCVKLHVAGWENTSSTMVFLLTTSGSMNWSMPGAQRR